MTTPIDRMSAAGPRTVHPAAAGILQAGPAGACGEARPAGPPAPADPRPAGAGALVITVLGAPVGQGAISYNKGGRGYHSNGKILKPWRAKVTAAAEQATGLHAPVKPPKRKGEKGDRRVKPCIICKLTPAEHGLHRGPVCVDVTLTFAPLKTPRRWPVTRSSGDWDHLGRAISDALTGVLWADDSQIVEGRVRKLYVGAPGSLSEPGAIIRVFDIGGSS